MKRYKFFVLIIFISNMVFGASVFARTSSGFIVKEKNFSPFYLENNTAEEIKILTPEDITVIIYNHGTTSPSRTEDCDAEWNKVPKSLLTFAGDKVKIFYLCSNAADNDGVLGGYIYKRVKEINQTIDQLMNQGIDSRRIFLAGHSAGAWSSLMSRVNSQTEIAGLILFAPAFGGRKDAEKLFPIGRQILRPKQANEIITAKSIRAIIFSYAGDPFGEPNEMDFLTKAFPDTIEQFTYRCFNNPNPHISHLNDCDYRRTLRLINKFIHQK